MTDEEKTKGQLIVEINELRKQVNEIKNNKPEQFNQEINLLPGKIEIDDSMSILRRTTGELAVTNEELTALNLQLRVTIDQLQQEISHRKLIEQELLTTKQRLEHLLAYNPAVIFSSKVSGDLGATYASDNVSLLFGYSAGDFIDIPNFFIDRIHPEDRMIFLNKHSELLLNGQCVIEFRFLHQDGSYRWTQDIVKLLRDQNGNPLEAIGCWIDITERKKTDKILVEQSRILELFFKHTLSAHAILDRDFNFIRVNEAYAKADNRDVSEFPGRNHFEFYPSDALEIFTEVVRTKVSYEVFDRPFIYPKNPERG